MPNTEALALAEMLIKAEIGKLNDTPRELANTVANIYYRFAVGILDMQEMQERGGMIPASMKREMGKKPLQELFSEFANNTAKVLSDKEAAAGFVIGLRDMDRLEQPNLYRYSVEFILDCIKYNIKDAANKTGFRRMIERKFKTVEEIPDLIDLMEAS